MNKNNENLILISQLLLGFIAIFGGFIFGEIDKRAHAPVDFSNIWTISMGLFILWSASQTQVCKLSQQVINLEKRLESLEGSKYEN